MTDFMFLYQSIYLLAAVLSIAFDYLGPIFNSVHILSIVVQNPVARNIVMAVIYPIQQLKIAAVVTLFVLYVFSIIRSTSSEQISEMVSATRFAPARLHCQLGYASGRRHW